jgi:hypothetical protein
MPGVQVLELSVFIIFLYEILALINHCTNIFIHSIQQNFSTQRYDRETTREELQTLMGLLLLLGVTKLRNLDFSEIWEKGGFGIDFIHSAMSQERFSFLLHVLGFDNIMDRQYRSAVLLNNKTVHTTTFLH